MDRYKIVKAMLADPENAACALHVLATRGGYIYPPPLKDASSGNIYFLDMAIYVAFVSHTHDIEAHLRDYREAAPFAVVSPDGAGFWSVLLQGEGRAFTLGPIVSERDAIEETSQAMQDEFGVLVTRGAPWL
jgi:hypothetical protein